MPKRFNNDIKLIATDFDGILTDGYIYFSSDNSVDMKRLSYKDIMGLSIAVKNGYKVAIISGDKTAAIDKVANKFKIEDVHQGIREKLPVLLSISEKYGIALENICYFGDDINDIGILEKVGVPITVPDANYKVKDISNIYITKAPAGNGAFREVIDFLMENRNR